MIREDADLMLEPSSLLRPLPKIPSLRQRALEEIRDSIVTGRLPAGLLVSEQVLAAQAGISRTPVREALLQLADEGLVEFERNAGVRITRIDEEHLTNLFQLRACIEGFCAHHSALRPDREALAEELHGMLAEQRQIIAAADYVRWIKANMEFHMRLVQQAGNQLMIEALEKLRSHTMRIGYQVNEQHASRMLQSEQEHRRIVDFIAAGEAEKARDAVTKHMTFTTDLMHRLLAISAS